jgi:hypothetical protein
VGRLATGSIELKSWKIPFRIKQGDLGGILRWGFTKDFRKIQYAMPCNASYTILVLKRFLYVKQI